MKNFNELNENQVLNKIYEDHLEKMKQQGMELLKGNRAVAEIRRNESNKLYDIFFTVYDTYSQIIFFNNFLDWKLLNGIEWSENGFKGDNSKISDFIEYLQNNTAWENRRFNDDTFVKVMPDLEKYRKGVKSNPLISERLKFTKEFLEIFFHTPVTLVNVNNKGEFLYKPMGDVIIK